MGHVLLWLGSLGLLTGGAPWLPWLSQPRLPAPATQLSWAAGGSHLVASVDGRALWIDAEGHALLVPIEDLQRATLSPDGRYVVGAQEHGFLAWDSVEGGVQEGLVPERLGAPVVLQQGVFGNVQVTETLAHHRLKRSGPAVEDAEASTRKHFVALWLDDLDPLLYVDTGFGLEVLHLWTGALLRLLDPGLGGGRVLGVDRDNEGRLVVALADAEGMRIWAPPDPIGPVWGLDPEGPIALGACGALIAAGDLDGVQLHSSATGDPLGRLLRTPRPVAQVAFSADGSHLAAALVNGGVKVWPVAPGELEVPEPVARPVSDVDVGRIRSGAVRAGSPDPWPPSQLLSLAGGTDRIRWDPSGRLMGWVGGQLSTIDPDTGALQPISERYIDRGRPFAWSPDGRRMAVVGGSEIRILDVGRGRLQRRLASGGGHSQLDWRGDVLIADAGGAMAQAWDPETGEPLGAPFEISSDPTARHVLSPDGRQLAIRGREPQILDALSGARIVALDAQHGGVSSLAWSPDGATLATVGNDGTVLLWSVGGWTPRALVEGAWGRQLAFSPDSRRLLSVSWERAVLVDVATGSPVAILPFDGLLNSVDWSDAGLVIGDSSGNLKVWRSDGAPG
ncbi:MAG TPA: WD40 repeat domain-containing protein [Deltaproteobacteria bacterium]|nr:WD40 repeat domain-containing protein [Deltaproteobacteria bacterium]